MINTRLRNPRREGLDIAVVHGSAHRPGQYQAVPAGHRLSRARLRHLRQSEWVVVTADSVPVGLAAYKQVESDVRVVHEFLLDPQLECGDATRVADLMLSALEIVAYDDCIHSLMLLVGDGAALAPFERRGYIPLVVDPAGAWLQKRLDRLGWVGVRSDNLH